MKRSKFTDSQILSILKQAESGTPVAELCREHISTATFTNGVLNLWNGCVDNVPIKRARGRK